MDGAGSITLWGYSPSLNLTEYVDPSSCSAVKRFLVIGSGDVRHLLHTLAMTNEPMEIYLVESQLEIYARQLLLLQLIFKSTDQLGLQEKCEHYLELFGNLHLNSHTEQYLKQSAKELIENVTSISGKFCFSPNVQIDLSLLKYKEKDFLEGIFQMWRSKQAFPAETAWDLRVRQYLGSRYDTRRNAFDWDLHMKLAERGFKRLNTHEYNDWRETGLAFRLNRQDYTEANRTLASSFVFHGPDGARQARRGYWADILTGPFVAHGLLPIDKDDPDMEKKANDKFIKTATDVSEYNVLKLLTHLQQRTCPTEIIFLPLNSVADLCSGGKERFRHLQFDVIFLACSLAHYLDEHKENFSKNLMDRNSSLMLELPKFLLDLKKEQIEQLENRYDDMAKALNCFPQENDELQVRSVKLYKYRNE